MRRAISAPSACSPVAGRTITSNSSMRPRVEADHIDALERLAADAGAELEHDAALIVVKVR